MKGIVSFLAVLLLSSAAYATEFQYQILVLDKFLPVKQIADKLNDAGANGWEFVSTERHIFNGSVTTYRYHLKKKK